MKKTNFILLLISLTILKCGHIYIEDLSIEWQNQDYFSTINIPFSLETPLKKSQIIKIILPIGMTSVTSSIKVFSSEFEYVSATNKDHGSSSTTFLVQLGADLSNNVWAYLVISGTAQSTQLGYYSQPVQMETYSGMDTLNTDSSIMYDYNYDCGFIGLNSFLFFEDFLVIAENPTIMQYLSISTETSQFYQQFIHFIKDVEKMPYISHGEVAETYTVYIDMQSKNDYLDGGVFQIEQLNSEFKFTGSCESISNICSQSSDKCKEISQVLNYNCSLKNSKIVFTSYDAVMNNKMIRLKIDVKNPNFPIITNNGIKILLYSRAAKLIYETKAIGDVFKSNKIEIQQPTIQFFWGLNNNQALNRGCPITIYKSSTGGRNVFNKVKIYFQTLNTFPQVDSYKCKMQIEGADYINDISIVSNLPGYNSGELSCSSVLDSTNSYIQCLNIGGITKNTNYYIGFSFVSHQVQTDLVTDKTTAEFGDFGKVQFFTSTDVEMTYQSNAITYSDSAEPRNNVDYTNGLASASTHNFNQIWDIDYVTSWTTPTYEKVQKIAIGSNSDNTGRNSIKYINNNNYFDLIMFLAATREQKCGTDTYCRSTDEQAHIMLKIITNNQVFAEFSEADQTNISNGLYKGIEMIKTGAGFMTNVQFTYDGSLYDLYKTISCDQFNSSYLTEENGSDPFCQTYSNYYTYNDILNTTNDKIINYYNQWELLEGEDGESSYYELQWACTANRNQHYSTAGNYYQNYNNVGERSICATTDKYDPTDSTYPSILLKKMKWSSNFKGNPVYPSQMDLDFIVCWRYDSKSTEDNPMYNKFTLGNQGLLASSGVINAQVINWEQNSTVIRYGFMNYYKSTGADENYLPMILRVGGEINYKDIEVNTGFAIFFDEGFDFTSTTVSVSDCASSDSEVFPTCFHKTVQYNNIYTNKIKTPEIRSYDYWIQYPSITVGATLTTSKFNFYIPVKYNSVQKRLFFVQLTYDYMFPTTLHTFKVYGNNEGCSPAGTDWKTDYVMSFTDMTATITFGDLTVQSDSSCDVSTAKFLNESSISPLSTIDPQEIQSTITGCSSDLIALNSQTTGWNSHFIVHSFEKLWESSDFVWPYENNASNETEAKCANMMITTSGANARNSFLIICPYEGVGNTPITNTQTLKVQSWEWGWNYGAGATIGKVFRFLWSGASGSLKSYKPVTAVGISQTGCLVSSGRGIYVKDIKQQKVQFGVYPEKSVKFTSEFQTVQVVNSFSFDPPLVMTTSKCEINIDNIGCTAVVGSKTIVLTLEATEVPLELSSGEWIFTIWINSHEPSSQQASITYISKIYGYFNDESTSGQLVELQTCDKKYQEWSQGTDEFSQYITVGNPVFTEIEGVRNYFEFTFKTNFAYYDFGQFYIDLDFLAIANQNQQANLRCAVYKNNEIAYDFLTMSMSNLFKIGLTFNQENSIKPIEIGLQSYKFKCTGAKISQTALTEGAQLSVAYYVGNTRIAYGNTTDLADDYKITNLTDELEYANVTLSKGFNAVGQKANYTFKVIANDPEYQHQNWTQKRILFKAGSTFFIEFARDIAPRFSKGGYVGCEQDGTQLPCSIIGERKISFPSSIDLDPNHINNSYGYNFTVYGVDQPYSLTKYNTMYFAIAGNSSKIENITYQTESLVDSSPVIQSYQPLVVNQFKVNITKVRESQTVQMEILIPKEAMIDGTPMFVEFSSEYQENFFNSWVPYCLLYNTVDSNNEAPHNYAANCSLLKGNRIQIFLTNDSVNNSTRRYDLEIQDIPGPAYSTHGNNMPVVYICSNSSIPTVPVYMTNNCSTNGSGIAFGIGNYSTNQTIIWKDNYLVVYKGTFKSQISLMLASGGKFLNDISVLGFTSRTVYEQFSFQPNIFQITTGKTKMSWMISPQPDTPIGLYQLKFYQNYTDKYAEIPPIFLSVQEEQFELVPSLTEVEVAYEGFGYPIIFSFENALPFSEVIMTGVIYDENKTSASKYFQLENEKQIITFNSENQIEELIFRVHCIKERNISETTGPIIGYIDFTLSGDNYESYSIDRYCVKVKYVEMDNIKPILTFNNIANSTIAGQQEFEARCSQLGMLYYVVSQNKQLVEDTIWSDIQSESLKKNYQQTLLNSYNVNPYRTIYGYEFVKLEQSINTVLIKNKLQSEAEYWIKMVCVNLFEQNSSSITRNFQQVSNGGKTVMVQLEFQSDQQLGTNQLTSLSEAQILEAVCILSEVIQREKDTVWAPNGQKCTTSTNSRLLLSSSVEIGDTSTQTDDNETQSYYFIAIPDYFIQDETIVDDITAILNDDSFETEFKTNAVALAGLNLYTYNILTNSKIMPEVNVPYIYCTEDTISLTFTMEKTNGFIFAGLVGYNETGIKPTVFELKKLSTNSYNFSAHLTQFFIKDEPIRITFENLEKDTSYKCYWIATNEDPFTLVYQIEIQESLRIMTEGRAANFACMLKMIIGGVISLALLVLL